MSSPSTSSPGRPTPRSGGRRPSRSSVVAAAVIARLGPLVHNVADLSDQTLLSPETFWPSLVTAALLALFTTGPAKPAGIGLFG